MIEISLTPEAIQDACGPLSVAEAAHEARWPAPPPGRQPVHTVYGGAHLFRSDTARKLGDIARSTLDAFAPDPATLAAALGIGGGVAAAVHARVRDKLAREPVEDLRIDFEDGYGVRSDEEEDTHAHAAAGEVAKGMAAGSLPHFVGVRVKPFGAATRVRALRTLDIFLTSLARAAGSVLPPGFVVTLPKIVLPEEVSALAAVLDAIEPRIGLPAGAIAIELMIETPEALVGPGGEIALLELYRRAGGRCVAAHLGAYDYTASLDVAATHQSLDHPACDFARNLMKAALARTGIRLSDGATTVLPIPPHRAKDRALRADEVEENRAFVHRALRVHHDNVRRALAQGFYQGWDLHPAQLVARYAAVYAFFFEGERAAAERVRNFVERAAQATAVGGVFDDAATGQGLLNFFLRAVNAGALSEGEAVAASGLSPEEIASRSFAAIVEGRRR